MDKLSSSEELVKTAYPDAKVDWVWYGENCDYAFVKIPSLDLRCEDSNGVDEAWEKAARQLGLLKPTAEELVKQVFPNVIVESSIPERANGVWSVHNQEPVEIICSKCGHKHTHL